MEPNATERLRKAEATIHKYREIMALAEKLSESKLFQYDDYKPLLDELEKADALGAGFADETMRLLNLVEQKARATERAAHTGASYAKPHTNSRNAAQLEAFTDRLDRIMKLKNYR